MVAPLPQVYLSVAPGAFQLSDPPCTMCSLSQPQENDHLQLPALLAMLTGSRPAASQSVTFHVLTMDAFLGAVRQ